MCLHVRYAARIVADRPVGAFFFRNNLSAAVRISRVGNLKVITQSFSSISQFGDSVAIIPRSYVLAIQRERPQYAGSEGNLAQFPLFRQPMAKVPVQPAEAGLVIDNINPSIDVGCVDIIGLSASAVLHVGSTVRIDAENRTKHIRQLLSRSEGPGPGPGT